MNICFCWSNISGYMASCWRALGRGAGAKVGVLAWQPSKDQQAPFEPSVMEGVETKYLDARQRSDPKYIASQLASWNPDVVVIGGWFQPAYRAMTWRRELDKAKFVLAIDTQYEGRVRQRATRLVFARYLKRIDRVLVPGERAWQYAQRLGFGEDEIVRGLYAVDGQVWERFRQLRAEGSGGWPRRLLFVGRYVREKGIECMLEAYRRYRAAYGAQAWELGCCGAGPLKEMFQKEPGVVDYGFVQPDQIGDVILKHGVVVLPSLFEPWGQSLVECCRSGMPAICSERCGASVEVVRDRYSGRVVPTGDPGALARAFEWCHEHEREMPMLGARASALARPYDADMWAQRVMAMSEELVGGGNE